MSIDISEVYDKVLHSPFVVLDTETTGLNWRECKLRMIGIASIDWCYVLLNPNNEELELIWEIFKIRPIVGHNLKFDLHVLRRYGLTMEMIEAAKLEDTMLMSQLVNENCDHSLQGMVKSLYRRERYEKNVMDMTEEELIEHNKQDIVDNVILYKDLKEFVNDQGLATPYLLEENFLKVLIDMEERGALIDLNYLREYRELLIKDIKAIETEFPAGLNLVSSKQVGEFLFNDLKIVPVVMTKGGKDGIPKASTSKKAIAMMDHPLAHKIEQYRHMTHTLNTFVDPYLDYADETARIHCNYNQLGARTGRLSCTDPNLQQVLNDERTRKIFIGKSNFVIADYSQVEAVIYSHYTGDKALIEMFNTVPDVYSIFASTIFNVPVDRVKIDTFKDTGKTYRDYSKTIFLGMIYGMGESKFRAMTGEGAYSVLQQQFPTMRSYPKEICRQIERDGYIQTIAGRYRRLLPRDSYKGVNAMVQGSARDIMVIAMCSFPKNIRRKMILTVHDEVDFEDVETNEIKVIAECMKDFNLKTKLRVSIGVGKNWWDADKNEVKY